MRATALETTATRNWALQGAALALTGLTLAACASGPRLADVNAPGAAGAPTSRYTGYKVGQPYQVKGIWYYPKDQPNYEEVGIASWYGEQFHNKYTADGEVFDMNMSSAAHKTLPLPSLVEVTNLANGRTVVVRVNDRGPFVDGRVIDMSKAAAAELGFVAAGITKVRVRYVGRALDPPGLKTPQNQTPPDLRQYQASLSKGQQAAKTGNSVMQMAGKAASLPLRLASAVPVFTPPPPAAVYAPLAAPAAGAGASVAASVAGQASHVAIADVDSLFSGSQAQAAAPAVSAPVQVAQNQIAQGQVSQTALPQARPPAPAQAQPQLQTSTVQQMAPQVGYELQAGTFPTQEAADHFASSLTGDGLPEVQPFIQDGQTAYRVVVHGLSSPAQAAAAKSEAMALGSPNPKITTAF
jgi:rare lipoprotein A